MTGAERPARKPQKSAQETRSPELFTTRNEALSLLSAFMTNVGIVFAGSAPEYVRNRELIFAPWRKARAEAARQGNSTAVAQFDAVTPPPSEP